MRVGTVHAVAIPVVKVRNARCAAQRCLKSASEAKLVDWLVRPRAILWPIPIWRGKLSTSADLASAYRVRRSLDPKIPYECVRIPLSA